MKYLDLNSIPELSSSTSLALLDDYSSNELIDFAIFNITWKCLIIINNL